MKRRPPLRLTANKQSRSAGFDPRSGRCIYRASRPSQWTVNGGAVSK